jgi:hypothetical protein
VITLNKVDLPEPLGPIIPVIDFSLISKEQSFKAFSPPNVFTTDSTCTRFLAHQKLVNNKVENIKLK